MKFRIIFAILDWKFRDFRWKGEIGGGEEKVLFKGKKARVRKKI